MPVAKIVSVEAAVNFFSLRYDYVMTKFVFSIQNGR